MTLVVIAFYGAGTYASIRNDAFHDFFVEKVPGGESLVSYFDGASLQNIPDFPKKSSQSAANIYQNFKGQLDGASKSVTQAQTAMQRELEKKMNKASEVASENINKIKAKTEIAVNNARKEAEKIEQDKFEVEAVVEPAIDKLHFLTTTGTQNPENSESQNPPPNSNPEPVTKPSGSRELDATPQPTAKVDLPAFEGKIPLGFEAPPGYSGSGPRSREPNAVDSRSQVAPAPISLPLVAPSVTEFVASEPILGQLAGTIDALAGFLRGLPETAIKSTEETGFANDILSSAEKELRDLGKRLDSIKAEQKATLEKRLDEQAKEYSNLLLQAEREHNEHLDKQESDWKDAFDSERQALIQHYKKKLEAELETQQEIINERLKAQVIAQGIEMQRQWLREIKLRVEKERGGRLARLTELEASLKSLERLTLDNEEYLDENMRLNRLWNAVRAANTAADIPRHAMKDEIRALSLAASRKPGNSSTQTQLIQLALDSIPVSCVDEGIESVASLQSWYVTKVAPRLKSAALLPDQAGLFSYFASWALSSLLFTRHGFVAGDDVASVMSRVDVYLGRRDLQGAAWELNQLQGWPKVLVRDWLEAARRHLAVKQALELTETEARLESLLL